MNRHWKTLLAATVIAASVHGGAAAAQETKSVVTGQVVDPGDAAIVGAQIDIRASNGAIVLHSTSDSQGRFTLHDLSAGSYVLDVLHDGFQETKQTLVLSGNGTEAARVQMPVSTLTQSVTVSASPALVTETPVSQSQAEVSREDFKNSPAITVADIVAMMPGVTFVPGNGPRDVAISVRGSSTRQTYGVRNVQVFEDGFPVTQPDGLARTDLTDPHAYSSVDVVRRYSRRVQVDEERGDGFVVRGVG